MNELVFVYGTLKRGFANHHHLQHAACVGAAYSVEPLSLVIAGVRFSPCVLLASAGLPARSVFGECYWVSRHTLKRLDCLERTAQPDGYRRVRLPVRLGVEAGTLAGHKRLAWVWHKPLSALSQPLHATDLCDYTDQRYQPR